MTKKYLAIFTIILLVSACTPQSNQTDITVVVIADGINQNITVPSGNSVQQALNKAGINLSQTDRVEPSLFTLLGDGSTIQVTRIREEFETQQIIIPFDRQELHNESLKGGETRLVQAGQNGLRELTIRHVFENEVETGSSMVSENILQAPLSEIVMVGVQSPFAPLPIPGKLAYLTGGNAWIMDISTSNRRPLVTTADLDGQIFSLSPDGNWLLFSRKSDLPSDQEINTLWVINTVIQKAVPISLQVSNVVHFAEWQPGKTYVIAYSTVEPRQIAPGWQANNDLLLLTFHNSEIGKTVELLDSNSGGIYGWWGMSFTWSPDGQVLTYSRPDGIGTVDLEEGGLTQLLSITPLNTHSDWAWTPGISWSREDEGLYLVTHAGPTGLVSPEESPNFDLGSFSLSDNIYTTLVQQAGMFAYPAVSPFGSGESESEYLIAYMRAIFPTQSASSRYLLEVMNSSGTDTRLLFPAEGQSGLQPQTPVWAPGMNESGGEFIGVIYLGNLWIVDAASGLSQQVTGDGLTSRLDWK